MDNWLARARKASGLSEKECAEVLRMTAEEYRSVESRPGTLTLNELNALCRRLGPEGRQIARAALNSLVRTDRRVH